MADDSKSSAIKGMDLLYEFEREPVSENKLQPGKHFAGIFAGEHVAGTEFVIGFFGVQCTPYIVHSINGKENIWPMTVKAVL